MVDAMFTEVQRFRQAWFWALVLGVAGLSWWAFLQQVVMGDPFGNEPASDGGVIILLLAFGMAFPVAMGSLSLRTEVGPGGLRVRFFPLTRTRAIPFSEVVSWRVRRYSPLREYGGWGVRYGREGKAYNVSGNMGLDLRLRDGSRLLIGTRRPEELEAAMRLLAGGGVDGAAQI